MMEINKEGKKDIHQMCKYMYYIGINRFEYKTLLFKFILSKKMFVK